jgi:hypothetical protein
MTDDTRVAAVGQGETVSLKLEVRADPGAGPALALAALDPTRSGLMSIEHLRLGLEQCNVALTTAELHMVAAAYSAPSSRGVLVRYAPTATNKPPSQLPPSESDMVSTYIGWLRHSVLIAIAGK